MKATRDRWPVAAVLLAAGRGRRLRPLTDSLPKCLLYAHGRAILDFALDATSAAGVSQVDIVVHHFADKIRAHVNERPRSRHVSFSEQKRLSGTADALAASRRNIASDTSTGYLLVAATDYVYPLDYMLRLCEFHVSHNAPITVSLRPITPQHAPASSIAVSTEDGNLHRIVEKPAALPPGPVVAASLLYIVPSSVYEHLPLTPISSRGERELPNTINIMVNSGFTARGLLQQPLETLDNFPVTATRTC
jgi:NDP-sugar pyrophosphorylase family protein